MKKIILIFWAMLLILALSIPVYAVDNEFGGLFRFRGYTQKDFSSNDSKTSDLSQMDLRARLRYTASIDEDFKVLMLLEMNGTYGEDDEEGGSFGSFGAKGEDDVQVKYLYADFNEFGINFRLGTQGLLLNRGFLIDDAISGTKITYGMDEEISVPFFWGKAYEGGMGYDSTQEIEMNDYDVDYYALYPSISLGADIKIVPTLLYITSKNGGRFLETNNATDQYNTGEFTSMYLGADVDVDLDFMSLWATVISQSGSMVRNGYEDINFNGALAALGASSSFDSLEVHGQYFYATGDDDYYDDNATAFQVPAGQSYYWAEIMGYGTFDNQVSIGSNGAQISNISALNIGVEYQVDDKLSLACDVWTASIIEATYYADGTEYAEEGSALGTEVDLNVIYKLRENVEAKLVYATLSAGDATTGGADNATNPTEYGFRLLTTF